MRALAIALFVANTAFAACPVLEYADMKDMTKQELIVIKKEYLESLAIRIPLNDREAKETSQRCMDMIEKIDRILKSKS